MSSDKTHRHRRLRFFNNLVSKTIQKQLEQEGEENTASTSTTSSTKSGEIKDLEMNTIIPRHLCEQFEAIGNRNIKLENCMNDLLSFGINGELDHRKTDEAYKIKKFYELCPNPISFSLWMKKALVYIEAQKGDKSDLETYKLAVERLGELLYGEVWEYWKAIEHFKGEFETAEYE